MKLKVNKRLGFTLAELLVTMFIATIALTMITGTIIFMSKANDELIEDSQNTYKIQIMMDKIHSEEYSTKEDYENTFKLIEGDLTKNGEVVVSDTKLENLVFYNQDEFIYCELVFPNKSYKFIVRKI
ncbi:MAG TPA: prepilin-type N-terminal cleavage/methylation domain-containing protein [Bacilli bacterium]|nr:prepilin-type N-terminal cleavage/methylation domain-containing protein [Bacilli bacterium]